MSTDKIMKMLAENRKTIEYAEASATVDFTETICEAMKERNLTKNQFAKSIGMHPDNLDLILGGGWVTTSLKLKDMVKLMHSLGFIITIGKDNINE